MITKQGPVKVKQNIYPTKVVAVPQSQTYNASNVPQGSPFGGGNLTTFEGSDKISYSTKRRSERHLSNTCDHQKYVRYYSGDASSPYRCRAASPHHADGWYILYTGGHTDLPHAQSEIAALNAVGLGGSIALPYFGNPQSDLDNNLNGLRPDLTQLSLPNFLLELDDVQKLWLTVKANIAHFQKLVARNAQSGSTAKVLAGDHLAWSFGVKPLVGDLQTMRNILQGLFAKLKAFDDLAGQITSGHKVIENITTTKTGTFNYLGNSQIPVFWTCVYTRKKTVGMTYRCDPREVTRGYTEIIKVLMDALGFELNPRILWDAIPFSFVLDWFFDVGSWLEQHKHDTLNLPITYVDSFVQCTQDVTIHSYFVQNKDDLITDGGRRTWPAWVTHKKRFQRFPAAPTESVFTGAGWSLPTLNQAKLLVSLGTVLR